MLRHITGALGRIVRAPVSTGANILPLALGLAAFIIAWGMVSWWQSSDAHFSDAGRIRLVSQELQHESKSSGLSTSTTLALARYLRLDAPELEAVARLRSAGEVMAVAGDRKVMLHGANAEADFFHIFKFNFLTGDPVSALRAADSIVLGQAAAEQLFGSARAAMGQRIVLNNARNVIVTGVIAPIPKPTHMGDVDDPATRFDYLSSWPADIDSGAENWLALQTLTYVLLPSDGRLTSGGLDQRLQRVAALRVPPGQLVSNKVRLGSMPLRDIQARRLDMDLFGSFSARLTVTAVLMGLGVMVLMVACLNYANLSTAQAVARFKQVGMRKVLGASTAEVVAQTFTESFVQAALALALAIIGCWLAAPVIAAQTGADINASLFHNPAFLPGLLALTIGVAFAAGLYPAIAIARVRPADALRTGKSRGAPRFVSQTLVGLQFTTASFLLIVVLVLGQQNAFLRQAGGQGRDAVVVLESGTQSGVSAVRLRQALSSRGDLMQVSGMDHLPWSSYTNLALMARTQDPLASDVVCMVTGVGFGYFEAFGAKVLAGRTYDQARDKVPDPPGGPPVASITPVPLVIDRSMALKLGFASPHAAAGQLIYYGPSVIKAGMPQQAYEIIGVIEDMPQHFLGAGAAGGLYALGDGAPFHYPVVRLAHGRESEALAALRGVWSGFTTRPFAPLYVSSLFERGFQRYDQTSRLFQGLSLLAFLISAAGLFGMAVHVIQRRRHEIGVRKTLGSTALRMVALLIKDFSKPVVIANVVAWPIAYLAAQAYLSSFMRRIDLTLVPFVLSFAITLGIAWIVVGAQTLRAASLRPADVLRHS